MNLGLGINIGGRAAGGFSPALLFAASEPGVWYDPSDFSTMFQESTGVTPVTAVGQSVGFLGDKSRGFVLGSELVTNGDFSSGTTGWTAVNGNGSVVDGKYRVEQTGAAFILARTQITGLTVGRTYRVVGTFATITNASNSQIWVGTALGAQDLNFSRGSTTPATVSVYFVAGATTRQVEFVVNAAGTGIMEIDNISVRELPGNHATQSNAASRPILGRVPVGGRRNLLTQTETGTSWTLDGTTFATGLPGVDGFTGGSFSFSNVSTNTNYPRAGVEVSSGTQVTCSAWIWVTSGTVDVRPAAYYSGAWQLLGAGDLTVTSTPQRFTWTYTPTTATSFGSGLAFRAIYSGGTGTVRVSGAQLETGSTATAYQRVVTAFDVTQAGVADCYYLSFDGSDDGMLTGTITPGTDKVQVFAGLRKLSDAATGLVAETSTDAAANNGAFGLFAPSSSGGNSYRCTSRGTTPASAGTGVFAAAPDTSVVTGIGDIAGDVATLRRNGAVVETVNTDQGTGNYLAYPLYIGRRTASVPFNGQLYQLVTRFGANLTADQITQAETWVGGKTGVNIPLWQSKTIYNRSEVAILDRANATIEVR